MVLDQWFNHPQYPMVLSANLLTYASSVLALILVTYHRMRIWLRALLGGAGGGAGSATVKRKGITGPPVDEPSPLAKMRANNIIADSVLVLRKTCYDDSPNSVLVLPVPNLFKAVLEWMKQWDNTRDDGSLRDFLCSKDKTGAAFFPLASHRLSCEDPWDAALVLWHYGAKERCSVWHGRCDFKMLDDEDAGDDDADAASEGGGDEATPPEYQRIATALVKNGERTHAVNVSDLYSKLPAAVIEEGGPRLAAAVAAEVSAPELEVLSKKYGDTPPMCIAWSEFKKLLAYETVTSNALDLSTVEVETIDHAADTVSITALRWPRTP
ncbi:MAG: hypothetical protein CMA10_04505 [Euryarchaeota archaeon]|nr:hypothetical protein [Euryarchaeota archaeon]